MSIKIVANGKIEVNNEKPILHFLTVMPEIPCLELYYRIHEKRVGTTKFCWSKLGRYSRWTIMDDNSL
jgi:hypothetical protein